MGTHELLESWSDIDVVRLTESDGAMVQDLFDRTTDYSMVVDGQPAGPTAGIDEFSAVPTGKSLTDKHVWGVVRRGGGSLIGVVESIRGHRDDVTWWLGLMLLDPAERGNGLGRRLLDVVARVAIDHGCSRIRLSVAEHNQRAFEFWTSCNFVVVDVSEPRTSGLTRQRFITMSRDC